MFFVVDDADKMVIHIDKARLPKASNLTCYTHAQIHSSRHTHTSMHTHTLALSHTHLQMLVNSTWTGHQGTSKLEQRTTLDNIVPMFT